VDKPKEKPREITYQVGWKRGTIRLDARGQATIAPMDNPMPAVLTRTERLLTKVAWRSAPTLSMKHWLLCMYAMPFIISASVLWLVLVLYR
jgi:hypothetical protein